MEVRTTRFGKLSISPDDVLVFPSGLMGFQQCRQWVLIADQHHDVLSWLQSVTRPEVAVAVVSPRRFAMDFQARIARSELAPLALTRVEDAQVLAIVGMNGDGRLTMNLKAPIVLNVEQRLGRQVVASSELSLQFVLPDSATTPLRKSA